MTTTKETWLDLASRCEEATGPDRELDIRIWMATAGWEFDRIEGDVAYANNGNWRQAGNYTKFTASLDEITRLCRRAGLLLVQLSDIAADGLPGALLCSDTSTTPPREHWGVAQSGDGALARALCAAYCKARSAIHVNYGGGTADCYCACANGGPCEHEFDGWSEFPDGTGGEQVCKRCGMGAMAHTMRTCWDPFDD